MSSKRRIRRKSCTGKVRHASVEAGQREIHRLHRAHGYDGRMNCYRCPFCNGWHIGHAGRTRSTPR